MSGMTYETIARIAQQGGSLYFMLIFLAGVAYALWPANRDAFRRAAKAPFLQDDHDDQPL